MKTQFKIISIFSALLLADTLLTPQNAEARPPRARELCGVVQTIDPQTHTLMIQSPKRDAPATFAVKRDAKFIKDWKFTDAVSLKAGLQACVYYHSPFFGKPFVTKIVWTNQHQPG